jgi:hypothetical protein
MEAWLDAVMDIAPDTLTLPSPLAPERHYGDYPDTEDPAQGTVSLASEGAGAPYTLLVVSGVHRGRLARYDVDSQSCEWVERVWPHAPATFLDWYEGWLDLVMAGRRPVHYGAGLIGPEWALARALQDRSLTDPIRRRAALGLGDFGSLAESTREVVQAVFTSDSACVRAAVVPLLAEGGLSLRQSLSRALQDPAPEVRAAATRRLVFMGTEDAQRMLVDVLDDPDNQIAESALIALRESRFLDVEHLVALYHRPALRQQVVSILRKFPCARSLETLMQAMSDPSAEVRRIAAFSVGDLGQPSSAVALRRALAHESDPAVRHALSSSLERLGSP